MQISSDADACHVAPDLESPPTREVSSGGDVVLVARSHTTKQEVTFLVDSNMLIPASKVFHCLFRGAFAESQSLRDTIRPRISLEDDNADAMDIIIRVLHHDHSSLPDRMTIRQIADIAIHCDKYDCAGVLKPWILNWLRRVEAAKGNPVEIGLLILTTFKIRASQELASATTNAATELRPDFPKHWKSDDMIQALPSATEKDISSRIRTVSRDICTAMQEIEAELQLQESIYEIPFVRCNMCGRRHPVEAKKCHPCRNGDLQEMQCTKEVRVSDYFGTLRQVGLWPSVEPFETLSLSELVLRARRAYNGTKHSCSAKGGCPLKLHLEEFARKADDCCNKIGELAFHDI